MFVVNKHVVGVGSCIVANVWGKQSLSVGVDARLLTILSMQSKRMLLMIILLLFLLFLLFLLLLMMLMLMMLLNVRNANNCVVVDVASTWFGVSDVVTSKLEFYLRHDTKLLLTVAYRSVVCLSKMIVAALVGVIIIIIVISNISDRIGVVGRAVIAIIVASVGGDRSVSDLCTTNTNRSKRSISSRSNISGSVTTTIITTTNTDDDTI